MREVYLLKLPPAPVHLIIHHISHIMNIFYRLAYSVYMIKEIKLLHQSRKIICMYDIGCQLEKHLRVSLYT